MKLKKIFTSTICLLTCFIFVILLSCKSVGAIYNPDLNGKVTEYKVSKANDELTMTVQYQYGIKDLKIYICSSVPDPDQCEESKASTSFSITEPEMNSGDGVGTYSVAVSNPSGQNDMRINQYNSYDGGSGKETLTYPIAVYAKLCLSRSSDGSSCNTWRAEQKILAESFEFEKAFTNSAEINTTIGKVLNIINNIIIPILWVALGVLLIVRGILLGMAIIKSADEPEVRSRKVGGLIWLIIGVFVGYVITITASYVMGIFGYGGYF